MIALIFVSFLDEVILFNVQPLNLFDITFKRMCGVEFTQQLLWCNWFAHLLVSQHG